MFQRKVRCNSLRKNQSYPRSCTCPKAFESIDAGLRLTSLLILELHAYEIVTLTHTTPKHPLDQTKSSSSTHVELHMDLLIQCQIADCNHFRISPKKLKHRLHVFRAFSIFYCIAFPSQINGTLSDIIPLGD